MNIVMLGAPGTGKGTVAKVLAKRLGMPHISTGDMFREQIKNGTELGKEIKNKIDNGILVSDELILDLIKKRIMDEDCAKGYILDGYPRNVSQAKAFEEALTELINNSGLKISEAYYIVENACLRLQVLYNESLYQEAKEGIESENNEISVEIPTQEE